MRANPITLITVLLLFSFYAKAQDSTQFSIQLRSGTFIPSKNISAENISSIEQRLPLAMGKKCLVIQFEKIPSETEKILLSESGIELLEYISGNAYTAIITGTVNIAALNKAKARSVFSLSPVQKMEPALAAGSFPYWAVKTAGTVDVLACFIKSFSSEYIKQILLQNNFDIISLGFQDYNTFHLRIAEQRLAELASLPMLTYIQAIGGEEKTLNINSRSNSRANVLTGTSGIGRSLNGSGITIGVGDEGDVQHIDLSSRVIARSTGQDVFHTNHVSGITAGAGLRIENLSGHAPKATVISQLYSGIISNAPVYVSEYDMVITNNSWGVIGECSYHGIYDFYSSVVDQQAFTLPYLQHVFAAGNSGAATCSPYLPKFRTVFGAHQSAKNIITVGNTSFNDVIYNSSSRGPVRDGRIKPEVVAQGAQVLSGTTNSNYTFAWGTSQAAPSVSGTLALLYQRYKQLNGSVNPANGLMKAILCNTADDKGNPGPDYTYGFGRINGLRAVEVIENNRYQTNTVSTGVTNSFNITVPASTAALKVMLYWNDPAAALVSSKALVNNLDLTVSTTTPAATYNPLILNINPSNVNDDAVPGVDTLNNIEQVTINTPTAGTYTINITGISVPVGGPQQYFVVYDFVPVATALTFPTGSERLTPGETVLINWDSYGGNAETFDLEYSTNNGSSWSSIAAGIAATQRQYSWVVPTTSTKDALVKITKNNTAQVSTSANFTVLGSPIVSLSPDAEQCEGYIKITWPAITDATGYEVMKLAGDEMQSVAILPNNTLAYTFSGLSKDTLYWVTVRAIYNGNPGRRGTAISRQPNTGNCINDISNDDIKADSIISPFSSGRLNTSTALSATTPLIVRVKNLDDNTSTAELTFSYSINGGATITDPSVSPTINAGATYDFTFSAPINLSAANIYSIEIIVVRTGGDPVTTNNTITKVYKQLTNDPITLPFTDNLETATNQTVTTAQMGLSGLDRYDFKNSTAAGRLRTFINSGMALSGTKAITLDAATYVATGNIDSLTGTFNLAGLDAASNDIRLDFRYKNHGQTANAANKLWIRGSDANDWIEAYDMATNQNDVDGTYKLSVSIEVSDLLRTASPGQNFSTSFQARWGQFGSYSAADNSGYSGYSIDDIKIYEVVDDLYLVSIDTPIVNSCNLSDTTPVKITIRNNSETAIPTLPGIPVRYRINNGAWINETITTGIAANSSYQYTFSDSANLSANGNYLIEAEVDYSSDSYHTNDTLSKTITNAPAITVTNSIPYLQGFETDNGSWYTGGSNNSWEYGTPSSYKINRAANGSKAWKTRNGGNYNDSERSYLYSPCFNISAVTNPTLSMSLALDLEDCGATTFCDGAYIEYSTNGIAWTRLGANGQGTNWYNKAYSGNNLWSAQNYTRWHVATFPLSLLPSPQNQYTRLQFRFVVSSDALVTREGIAIDDIHIYSNPYGIYDVTGTSPIVNVPVVNNSNWIDFVEPGTNKIIASVNPDGQDLGSTNAQAYIYSGPVRTNTNQYYHNRNITIKPTNNSLADSTTVRFYFLDSETEALLNATGCATCYKPTMAYELGISKYSDLDDTYEDGIVENGLAGVWLFINSAKVQKVPFDKGYYAQYRVKDFSEFWLNNGGLNGDRPLPLQLISFTAKKTINNKDVLTEWATASEFNINRFEIEVARSQQEYLRNEFIKIGVVNSTGNSSVEQRYSYTDAEENKSGIRYYRLKIIEKDSKFSYTAIRPVLFANDKIWTIQPNPSAGLFYLGMQAGNGQLITINVTDMSGRVVQQQQLISSGFVQKISINLESSRFATGFYLLEATTERGVKQQFKLLKQ
jgi:hypothetical protein